MPIPSPPISWEKMTDAQKFNYLLRVCSNVHEWIDEVTPQIQTQIQTMSTRIHHIERSPMFSSYIFTRPREEK
jgi:hypothetical protein